MGAAASVARPALSIIVPSRDRPDKLARCLASLRAAAGPDDELIVVDSASTDAVAYEHAASAAGATYVRCDRPGVNRARNAGAQSASRVLLAYVDDDVTVEPTWADAFAAAAAAHPTTAFFTGRVRAAATEQRHGNVAVKDDPTPAVLTRDTRGDLGHGNNVLVRADALARIGGWDDALGAGAPFKSGPEADLYDRLFRAGFTGRYEPAAVVAHEQWRDSKQLIALDWRYGFGNGARLSKLVRHDRHRARRIGAEAVWTWGLQPLGPALRTRNKTDIARISARLAGTGAGFARGLLARVHQGRFVDVQFRRSLGASERLRGQ